jgi:hypothetical protein
MQTDDLTPTLTSNGIRPLEYDRDGWLIHSRQKGKRHPLDPLGVCMSCGDHKIGHWMWVSEEPND